MGIRAEMRRAEKAQRGVARKYTLTAGQIQQIKNNAVHDSMVILLGVPLLVLREQYGFGKKRLSQFAEALCDYYQEFAEGNMTPNEYQEMVLKYTGIKFERTDRVV